MRRGDWVDSAVCASADPDEWFPEMGASNAVARRLCGGCPVQMECLDDALSLPHMPYGVWAGLGSRDIQNLWSARRGLAGRQPHISSGAVSRRGEAAAIAPAQDSAA